MLLLVAAAAAVENFSVVQTFRYSTGKALVEYGTTVEVMAQAETVLPYDG